MAEPGWGRTRMRRWARGPLRSVRVRITLAATLVTAVAVVAAGWLLVRAVEGTQRAELADRTEERLDDVAAALERGVSPPEAVATARTDTFVEVVDDAGCPVAFGPVVPSGDRQVTVMRIDAATATGILEETLAPAPGSRTPAESPDVAGQPDRVCGAAAGGSGATGGESGEAGAFNTPFASGDLGARFDRIQQVRGVPAGAVPVELVTRTVDTPWGTLTVQAAAPVDEVERSVAAVRRALWWGLPVLVALVAGVAWGLVGRALRPVEAIRGEVEAIGGASMHRRVPEPTSDDEIGRLARTMNAMLGRLEASARRQRQFVSDASHELRSPVAAIRSDVEVALLEGAAANWPAVGRAVLGEEARLERLLDDLLVLAAADEAGACRATAPVDVAAVVTAEAERARRVPVRVTVDSGGPEGPHGPLSIEGDAGQLRRVVANLLDNAARHARAAVEVTVAGLASPAGAVRVTVDDDGTGIAPADRERVFERFTRLDEGRARDQGGTGLGLAVVRSLVTHHGGRVWVEEAPALGGARFVVDLPASCGTNPRFSRESAARTAGGSPPSATAHGAPKRSAARRNASSSSPSGVSTAAPAERRTPRLRS